jgi:hypothetical protein
MKMYYVTMTDKFMSGWGEAKGKTNKLVFICETYEQAKTVANNAENRSEMKYVNICTEKPRYDVNRYLTQFKTIEEAPTWYREGYMKKRA